MHVNLFFANFQELVTEGGGGMEEGGRQQQKSGAKLTHEWVQEEIGVGSV